MAEDEKMRTLEEVERAHIVTSLIRAERGDPDYVLVQAIDLLCWVLGHRHPTNFGAFLDKHEKRLAGKN